MAPEVVNRRGHTQSADWWSFGVLMVMPKLCLFAAGVAVGGIRSLRQKLQYQWSFSERFQWSFHSPQAILQKLRVQRLACSPHPAPLQLLQSVCFCCWGKRRNYQEVGLWHWFFFKSYMNTIIFWKQIFAALFYQAQCRPLSPDTKHFTLQGRRTRAEAEITIAMCSSSTAQFPVVWRLFFVALHTTYTTYQNP